MTLPETAWPQTTWSQTTWSQTTWSQTYLLFGHGMAFSVFLASLPIFTLLLLLGVFRRPAWMAGLCGLIVTFALAIFAYHMPVATAVSAAANGAAFGLFPISWIVFPAILLFRVTVETGQFEIIKNSLGRLTPDPRLQALLIAFAFGGFLEGAAGFGTPVAIAASMLIGLGFSPFSAAAICLLANTAPVAFGSIGIPVFTLAGTTGLSLAKLSAAIGAIVTPLAILLPAYLVFAIGGLAALNGIWLPVIVAGLVFGGGQFLIATYLGPQLTDILAAIAAMASLVLLLRLWRARVPGEVAGAVTAETLTNFARLGAPKETKLAVNKEAIPEHPLSQVLHAWTPYAILVACVLLWGYAPFQRLLNSVTFVIKWPYLNDVVRRMPPIVAAPAPYHALYTVNWLSAAGTACMTSVLLSALLLRLSPARFGKILLAVIRQLLLPTATVSCVIAIAFLMNFCGATATLGLAFASTGTLFPFFSALLGWVGVFLTGSDTSANALFGNLQVVSAERLHFDPILMAAANSAGGVMGKMISLQTIAIAAAATGLSAAEQVRLFRFTLKHSIVLAVLTGLVALLYSHTLHFS